MCLVQNLEDSVQLFLLDLTNKTKTVIVWSHEDNTQRLSIKALWFHLMFMSVNECAADHGCI